MTLIKLPKLFAVFVCLLSGNAYANECKDVLLNAPYDTVDVKNDAYYRSYRLVEAYDKSRQAESDETNKIIAHGFSPLCDLLPDHPGQRGA